MMNGPFFRNSSDQTRQRSLPKVISVPIHFVSSDQPRTTLSMLRDSAALKIQKVLRGFLVRKSVKKVVSIRNEVSEIQRRINDIEFVDTIRRDAKERLRVNETLMSLLFKLDSIRGVDCGVRDLRKAVTRKAIALQEKVDSIAQADCKTLDLFDNNSGEIDCRSASEQVMETDPAAKLKEMGKEDLTSIGDSMEVQKDGGNGDRGNRELLEKMMADNDKMTKLMMQISERNEMQTRMINSLSRRVEQLEKALMTDKLRRKKKTNVAVRRRDKDRFLNSVAI